MHNVAVFLGPSLNASEARSLFDAEYLPPIKRRDHEQLDHRIKTVGIVDGEFYQSLAVSPKEILSLLDGGIEIYGASSMGALRAVETCSYGMKGVGKVFEMYKNGVIDGDDEVALAYDRETFSALSEPLVNIRHALDIAQKHGLIETKEVLEVTNKIKKLYFPFRSYAAVVQICPAIGAFLATSTPNLKRDDAKLLLRTMAARSTITKSERIDYPELGF
jgi:hypothetical protein